MIPVRIQVAGFLCYREPQEACFEGRTLWMLAGHNGSGKSALFDAVTYALFGQHRGGRHNARGLIHHECEQLVIEFDFALDDQLFRARRTLARQGRATRQILVRPETDRADPEAWNVVTETHTERGFARWIDTHVALNYETFTASVLLMQGKADNLLLATPAQRHRLLCQVVGLDRIETLAQRAQKHFAQAEGATNICRQQLQQVASVNKATLRDLRQKTTAAEQQLAQHSARFVQLTNTFEQAKRWQDLTKEITKLNAKLDPLAEQLTRLQQSESQQRHRAERAAHVAALHHLLDTTTQVNECRAEIEHSEAEQIALKTSLERQDRVLHGIEQTIIADRQQLTQATTREKHLARQHAEQTLACATATRFAQARDKLRRLLASIDELQQQLQEARQQQVDASQAITTDQTIRTAQETARDAAKQLARHELQMDQLRQQFARFQSVAGTRACPYCRQPLDRAHYAHEEQRLQQDLRKTETGLQQSRHACTTANHRERCLRDDNDRKQKQHVALTQRTQQLATELQGVRAFERELTDQCQRAYQELPADLQAKITASESANSERPRGESTASIATTFPHAEELRTMQQGVNAIARELTQLARSNPAMQRKLDQSTTQQRQLTAKRQAAAHELDECNQHLAQQRGKLSGYVAILDTARATVPHQWRDLSADQLTRLTRTMAAECQSALPASGDHDEDALRTMSQHLHALQTRCDLLTEQRSSIPAAAQCSAESLEPLLNDASNTVQRSDATLSTLRTALLQAEQQNERRQVVREQLRATQQQCRLWQRVTKLLGRDGLQRALLETAEQAIVQYANTILDRLTGGQLYVELARRAQDHSRAGKVLDLVAHTTGGNACEQDVAFLSGSQKFRVAVALSLAIGQFASNTRRPVQAVIIDEGFGCLDTTNRQVMIQELQNLRGHLQRILLVSHQDEFVSAFPDGYRCELINGATRLTPFHA